jgi:hypothetical protein
MSPPVKDVVVLVGADGSARSTGVERAAAAPEEMSAGRIIKRLAFDCGDHPLPRWAPR